MNTQLLKSFKIFGSTLAVSFATATLLASTVLGTTAVQADELNLGNRKPSSQEIIDHLKPTKKRRSRTRGIRVLSQPPATATPAATDAEPVVEVQEPAAPASPAAISMQVLFEFNSAVLTREAIEYLHPLGQALQSPDLSGMRFMLEGHTDAVGPDDYNLTLSQKRAQAVKHHLLDHYGVSSAALDVTGRGELDLLEPQNPTGAANRRVRIVSTN